MGVCTCTTPAASFSINIPGPTWNLKLARAILGPPLLHHARCNGKPFFKIYRIFNRRHVSAALTEGIFGKKPSRSRLNGCPLRRSQNPRQTATSGRISMWRIWAATPNSEPSSSTRTMVAWQQTQHFSPACQFGREDEHQFHLGSLFHAGLGVQEHSVGADVASLSRLFGALRSAHARGNSWC